MEYEETEHVRELGIQSLHPKIVGVGIVVAEDDQTSKACRTSTYFKVSTRV